MSNDNLAEWINVAVVGVGIPLVIWCYKQWEANLFNSIIRVIKQEVEPIAQRLEHIEDRQTAETLSRDHCRELCQLQLVEIDKEIKQLKRDYSKMETILEGQREMFLLQNQQLSHKLDQLIDKK